GITSVPPTALVALCWRLNGDEGYLPDCPAMIFPIVDNARTLGIHVTWLNGDLTHKLERKMYGPIRGGYVELYKGKHDAAQRLIIGEGVENALAAAQLAGLPAISALSATNMPKIMPPPAAEYIIAADNDVNGQGQRAARALAARLTRAGFRVRV